MRITKVEVQNQVFWVNFVCRYREENTYNVRSNLKSEFGSVVTYHTDTNLFEGDSILIEAVKEFKRIENVNYQKWLKDHPEMICHGFNLRGE